LYSQALAKIERGHAQDLEDVRTMLSRGLIDGARLRVHFERIKPNLYKYPAIDAVAFERALDRMLG
jgi:hypothetical protein